MLIAEKSNNIFQQWLTTITIDKFIGIVGGFDERIKHVLMYRLW